MQTKTCFIHVVVRPVCVVSGGLFFFKLYPQLFRSSSVIFPHKISKNLKIVFYMDGLRITLKWQIRIK